MKIHAWGGKMSAANDISIIAKTNRAEIYEFLFKNGDSSIARISAEIGLSLPAVTRAIEVGIDQGLFMVKNIVGAARGRKAKIYGLNPDCGHSVSLYIAKDDVIVTLKDFTAKTIKTENISIIPVDIVSQIDSIIEKYRQADKYIKFIFVIISGDVHEGKIIACSAHPQLISYDLKKHLKDKFQLITLVENDMFASVTSGFKYADNPVNEIIVTFLFGQYVCGAGLMINNVPFKGASGRQFSLGELPYYKHIKKALPYIASKLKSIIILLNPHTVILINKDNFISCDELISEVKKDLPPELIPTFYERNKFMEYCITGMIRLCIEEIKQAIIEDSTSTL